MDAFRVTLLGMLPQATPPTASEVRAIDEWLRPSPAEWLARFGEASPETLVELFD